MPAVRARRTADRPGIASDGVSAPQPAAVLRDGRPADRAFVEDLGRRTIGDSIATFRRGRESLVHASLARLFETVFAQSHVLLVAEVDGAPAGFVLFLDAMPDEVAMMPQAFVAYMAVEPALQSRGIGSALLEYAENEARRRGLPYMGLMVTEENASARALYERAGYVTERRLLCKPL